MKSHKLTAANTSVSQWDHFYFRSGTKSGYRVATVHRTPGLVGVWNVLRPWGNVKTAQLNARSAFTRQPIGGVAYTTMPFLDPPTKQSAIAKSAALTATQPTKAELGPYKKSDYPWSRR